MYRDGAAGLQHDSAFAAMRIELERFADIVFSGREKDRLFWLGQGGHLNPAAIEAQYRALKPCLNGSDAHALDATGEPPQERYCWLKGDLAFETLRQAVVEPENRVRIGPSAPANAVPAYVVESVAVDAAPWLETPALQLNPGLVAIIGARGSGKTALADIIATAAHADDAGKGAASFLKRASSPVDYLSDAEAILKWGDGTTTAALLKPDTPSEEQESVRYLSQHFVERLCSSSGLAKELRAAIEGVVFESTDPMERMEADSFGELARSLLQPIREMYTELQAQVEAVADAIVQSEILEERLPLLNQQKATLEQKLQSAKAAQQKLVPPGQADRARRLAELESAVIDVQTKIESLRTCQQTIQNLGGAVKNQLEGLEPARFAQMKFKYDAARLTPGEWTAFRMAFAGDTASALSAAAARSAQAIAAATEEDLSKPFDRSRPFKEWPLDPLKVERDKAKTAVGIDAAQQKKYDESQRQIAADQLALSRTTTLLEQASGASAKRLENIALRRSLYVQIFQQLIEQESTLERLYAPLSDRLSGAQGALAKLAFVIERTIDLDRWSQQGEALFDLRSGKQLRGRGAIKEHAEKLLMPAWRRGTAEDVAIAMDAFRTQLKVELKNMPPWVSQDERRNWNRDVAAWLYDTSHIQLRYGIEYDGVAIEQLSPGTRGVVLLLLYLAVDRYDCRPLIVDQPEENLDPNSVFEELVPHFKEARLRRQVIIVTHNANLVVNTDADQVIIATSSRAGAAPGLPNIQYQSGSLENAAIRAAVCQILEGGSRAFLERERRYRLRWGQDLIDEMDQQQGSAPN